jgi:hypothetical protein
MAARRIWWIRAARGQSERGGAFLAFGLTAPRTRQSTNLFSRPNQTSVVLAAGKKSPSSTLFGPTYHESDEARVPHQHVQLLQSRRDSAAAGWRSALRSPPPFIVNGPACNSYAYELAGKGSRRACSRDMIGCEWSQASARATAFAANSPFPYVHRNDWSPPN